MLRITTADPGTAPTIAFESRNPLLELMRLVREAGAIGSVPGQARAAACGQPSTGSQCNPDPSCSLDVALLSSTRQELFS